MPELERSQVAAFVAAARHQQRITVGGLESSMDARRAPFAKYQVGYDERLTLWHGGSTLCKA
jgi:hypothetical protein